MQCCSQNGHSDDQDDAAHGDCSPRRMRTATICSRRRGGEDRAGHQPGQCVVVDPDDLGDERWSHRREQPVTAEAGEGGQPGDDEYRPNLGGTERRCRRGFPVRGRCFRDDQNRDRGQNGQGRYAPRTPAEAAPVRTAPGHPPQSDRCSVRPYWRWSPLRAPGCASAEGGLDHRSCGGAGEQAGRQAGQHPAPPRVAPPNRH